ncbi:MAG: SHOCT domain-containing protein [Sporolactobacillus sp.]|jgi:putative membrane protein|nr:SHOCT domain-containing protein [Sporolactobacillus sp.]
MMGWHGGMMGGFGIGLGLIGWLIQLALFIAVIYLAVVLIRRVTERPPEPNQSESWETVLKERFARGEISEEEYNKMKNVLRR